MGSIVFNKVDASVDEQVVGSPSEITREVSEKEGADSKSERQEKVFSGINKASKFLDVFALSWVTPLLMMAAGDSPKRNLPLLGQRLVVPIVAILTFLAAWAVLAPQVKTSLGAIPGPAQVWEQAVVLHKDHLQEKQKAGQFYERQAARNDALIAAGREGDVSRVSYTGKQTFYQQIWTSLQTVFFGFFSGRGDRGSPWHRDGHVVDHECGVQSSDPDIQTGVAAGLAPHCHHDCLCDRCDRFRDFEVFSDVGNHGDPVFPVAHIDQHGAWRGICRQGSRQCGQGFETEATHPNHKAHPAICVAAYLYRYAPVPGCWLDGFDCSGDACAESGIRKICVG